MRIMLRAAMAALSIASIGSAYADGGDGVVANTEFTEIPGVVAQAPAQSAPLVAATQDGQADQTYESHANRTTWLFPPVGKSRPVKPATRGCGAERPALAGLFAFCRPRGVRPTCRLARGDPARAEPDMKMA